MFKNLRAEMGTTFEEDFLNFLFQRRLVAHSTMLREDSEQGKRHAHYTEQYSKIHDEIYERLGSNDEAFGLLFDFSDAANLAAGIEMDATYIQGIQYGFRLVEILKKGITWPAPRGKYEQEENA